MDKFDELILHALMENGRLSYAELARRVNLSPPAVAERVAKLEAKKVITGYHAHINLEKMGLDISFIVELRLNHNHWQNILQALTQMPQILQCYRVTGEACVMIRGAVRNMAALEAFIEEVSRFGATKTSIILSAPVERIAPLSLS
ncbi:Lrp/AsnC family transcriptional regulator [Sodalis ligni]|jgi:Lrp/AsnC family leucine-responsive transcriptional regulator|uniref:AsnC family transcriptional regulator n=1 Tax=Sodalis ligni TaxID=2697027 RepID=A0A4R1NC26_9GAMM|nr:Lrp/AsnC family transcriptional regulator [Sodalis ligni]QWA12219.1 Lrp/AsnC family transcriptional regulator [Sodalis ligni]TCL04367.1 AsnC family transcriptional regulator [Sodalis ligni]